MKKSNKRYLTATILSLVMLLSLCGVTIAHKEVAKAATIVSNPTTDSKGVTTWDCLYFGSYWQNDTNGDGKADQSDEKTPIKWRVLSVNGTDAFLLADQSLDARRYNEELKGVVWEECTLRTWLNSTFFGDAFTASEQAAIKHTSVVNAGNPIQGAGSGDNTTDQIYLLSLAEASNTAYGFNGDGKVLSGTREAKKTAYAKDGKTKTKEDMSEKGTGLWWLRTSGSYTGRTSYIDSTGVCETFGDTVESEYIGVRPALHLNLSSSKLWTYTGKMTASGGTKRPDEKVTKQTTPVSTTTQVKKQSFTKRVVKITSAKNKKKKKITLKYKRVSGAKGYQIQYSTKKNFKKKKTKTTSKTSYTIKKLKKKKTYYIRVRAYQWNGKKKVYGKWSKVKKVKVKK